MPSDLWEQLSHKYIRNDRDLQGSQKVPLKLLLQILSCVLFGKRLR